MPDGPLRRRDPCSHPVMRKKLMLAALLLLGTAVGIWFLLSPKQPTLPAIGSEFLGFTNMPAGSAARFSITNYPDTAIFPAVVGIALLEKGVWNPMPKPARGWPFLQLAIGGQPQVVYTLSAPTTTTPVRLVMEIRTKPTGWRALAQRLAVRVGRDPGKWHVRLPALYFTNETVVTEATLKSPTRE
jgi:hypothetical protein